MSADIKTVLTEFDIHRIQGDAYTALCANGYNGGMGGLQWDMAHARAIERAVLEAAPASSAMAMQADTDTPEQEIAGLKAVVATLGQALGRLSFAAQTTGGTAGRDEELVAAIKWAERALSLGSMGRAYCEAADAQQSPVQASEQKDNHEQ